MKKIYGVIGVIFLIVVVITLSMLKNRNITKTNSNTSNNKIYQSSDLFTDRDMQQNANISNAKKYTVTDNENITITTEGIYVISGTAKNVTIYVEAEDSDKVQLVLENLSIVNEEIPVIYVKTADKVFITSNGNNTLKVTGAFAKDDSEKLNAVVFSKQDITFNGIGTLNIESSQNGITGKDDIKITGGTYNIVANAVGIRANDSIRIADGTLNINAGTDGLHAENGNDDSKGYVFIAKGTIKIDATDDCIHGSSIVQIDDGNIALEGSEGVEGTYIQINGGTISINAKDDGINAGSKSESYKVMIEITGGDITITMASENTDGIDSNGDLSISGGTINVTGGSGAFDYDGTATYTGGTIIINGVKVDKIPESIDVKK